MWPFLVKNVPYASDIQMCSNWINRLYDKEGRTFNINNNINLNNVGFDLTSLFKV